MKIEKELNSVFWKIFIIEFSNYYKFIIYYGFWEREIKMLCHKKQLAKANKPYLTSNYNQKMEWNI